MSRKASHVHFVDDGLVHRATEGFVPLPVIVRGVDDHALHRRGRVVTKTIGLRARPVGFTRDALGIGIQQQLELVEALPLSGTVGTVHPIGVDLSVTDPFDKDVPIVKGPD